MKGPCRSLALVAMVLACISCNAARISGTYVAHAATFAEMLQLTQTNDGQIKGVLSHVELKQDGAVTSEQISVNGTVDANQLTLTAPSLLSFLPGSSFSGTNRRKRHPS